MEFSHTVIKDENIHTISIKKSRIRLNEIINDNNDYIGYITGNIFHMNNPERKESFLCDVATRFSTSIE